MAVAKMNREQIRGLRNAFGTIATLANDDEVLVAVNEYWIDDWPTDDQRCPFCHKLLVPGTDGSLACDGMRVGKQHPISVWRRMRTFAPEEQ